ncbi:unnamed protein product [Amaranthus hypochondriacus]
MAIYFLLHFPFILFFLLLAKGDNLNYTACSIPYSCGHIKNVGYPFWGENRPKFCGMADFQLGCGDDYGRNNSVMKILGSNYIGLSIININTSSQTIVFSMEMLFKHCFYVNASNISLLPMLKPNKTYKGINIFYGCPSNVSMYQNKMFKCSDSYDGVETKNGTAYYFDKRSDMRRVRKLNMCKNNITFPLDKRGFDELRKSNVSLISILNKWPFEVKYLDEFTACSKCVESGGMCGSPEDSSSDHFMCHCRDGSHQLSCPDREVKRLGLIIGLGIAGGILVLIVIIGGAFWHPKKLRSCSRRASLSINASNLRKGNVYFGLPVFSYEELVEATGNFDESKVLGNGGFGTVYYGKLKDGREVAVKRLYEKTFKRVEQFMNEVELLTCLRHKNLVSLYGCTSHHSRELLLVYEFIKNGTVSDHLYGDHKDNSESLSLPWPVRLNIAIETATALSYLHANDIIHRDVKTNNILLDNNFGVKVVDFGLSRLFPANVTHVSTAPQGTPGYLDPEYFQCYRLTDKSDVYSFGVVLIELISSLPAIDLDRCSNEINLSTYAIKKIQRRAFEELVDPQLGFALDTKVRSMTTSVAELAFRCLQHDKSFRPSMDDVLEGLKRIEGADYEALQAPFDQNDYDTIQEQLMAKDIQADVVTLHINDPSPSPAEDDHARLLSTNRLFSSSPISVMDKWVSNATTPCTSK